MGQREGVSVGSSRHLDHLRELPPAEFEQFVGDLFVKLGWNTTVTRAQGDRGVDVIAERETPVYTRAVIQAKRYGPGAAVGSPEIQQYASLRQQEDADLVIVVTTSRFSKQAEEISESLNVRLIDGNRLIELMDEAGILKSQPAGITTADVEFEDRPSGRIPLAVHAVLLIQGTISPIVVFLTFIFIIAAPANVQFPTVIAPLVVPGVAGTAIFAYFWTMYKSRRPVFGWLEVVLGLFGAVLLQFSTAGMNPVNSLAFGASTASILGVWSFYHRTMF